MVRKRQNNLVCQYLENISKKVLEKYQGIIRKYVRRRHGIYALYRKQKLYYVGLASNLRSRLRHHLRDRHATAWDSFSIYLTVGDEHIRELEAMVLRIIDRKGNKQRGKFALAEDLQGKLKQDIRKYQVEEIELLFGKTRSMKEINKSLKRKSIPQKVSRKPTLAPFVKQRFKIKFNYKNKQYFANVRKDGSITFTSNSTDYQRVRSKVFTSPSLAATHITGRPMNGWLTWKYERAPGDWVLLDVLRK